MRAAPFLMLASLAGLLLAPGAGASGLDPGRAAEVILSAPDRAAPVLDEAGQALEAAGLPGADVVGEVTSLKPLWTERQRVCNRYQDDTGTYESCVWEKRECNDYIIEGKKHTHCTEWEPYDWEDGCTYRRVDD